MASTYDTNVGLSAVISCWVMLVRHTHANQPQKIPFLYSDYLKVENPSKPVFQKLDS